MHRGFPRDGTTEDRAIHAHSLTTGLLARRETSLIAVVPLDTT